MRTHQPQSTFLLFFSLFFSSCLMAKSLGLSGDYNAFILENFTANNSRIEGRLAVGGNVEVNSLSIGDQLTPDSADRIMMVGGDLYYGNGRIYYGDIIVAGTKEIGDAVIYGLETEQDILEWQSLPINFAEEFLLLSVISEQLSLIPANTMVRSEWDGLYLEGDCESPVQVFNLSGETLLNAHTFEVTCIPDEATIIFNISGETAGLSGLSLEMLTAHRTKVLYNFYQTTELILESIEIEGSILAPLATIKEATGTTNGTVIAKSWQSEMHLNYPTFEGDISFLSDDLYIPLVYRQSAHRYYLAIPMRLPANYPPLYRYYQLSFNGQTWVTTPMSIEEWTALQASAYPEYTQHLLLGDFNHDGKQDVMIKADNYYSDALIILDDFTNQQINTFNGSELGIDLSIKNTAISVLDKDNDGADDIAVANYILFGNRAGEFKAFNQSRGPSSGNGSRGNTSTISSSIVVGETKHTINVGSNGALTVNVPLSLPEAPADFIPPVALGYSSHYSPYGLGAMGFGWSLKATKVIHRCSKNLASDDKANVAPIQFDKTDRLCLNGSRLKVNSATDKNIIVSDDVYWQAGQTYHLELEDFSTITAGEFSEAYQAPSTFTMLDKKGVNYTFTHAEIIEGDKQHNNQSAIQGWKLALAQDTNGNLIKYNYDDSNVAEQLLSSIEYLGQSENSLNAKVFFNYIDAPDKRRHYRSNTITEATNTKLLDNIEITLDGEGYRYYQLNYNINAHAYNALTFESANLKSIQECIDTLKRKCFNPISFDWQLENKLDADSIVKETLTSGLTIDHTKRDKFLENPLLADFNGDGKTDLIYQDDGFVFRSGVTGSAETLGSKTATQIKLSDFDGDGLLDVVFTEDKKTKILTWSNGEMVNIDTGIEAGDDFADLNGDGLLDVLLFSPSMQHVFYNQKGKQQSPTKSEFPFAFDRSEFDTGHFCLDYQEEVLNALSDINGDGKPEFVVKSYCQLKAYNGTHSETFLQYSQPSGYKAVKYTPSSPNYIRMDINGDGLLDLVDNPTSGLYYALNSGKSEADLKVSDINGGRFVSDLNNDGYADVVSLSGGIKFYLSQPKFEQEIIPIADCANTPNVTSIFEGGATLEKQVGGTCYVKHNSNTYCAEGYEKPLISDGAGELMCYSTDDAINYQQFYSATKEFEGFVGIADIDSDGFKEVLLLNKEGQLVAYEIQQNYSLTKIDSITTNEKVTAIDYKNMRETSVYPHFDQELASLAYPLTRPLLGWLVESITHLAPDGSQYVVDYKYYGAQSHSQGRGFLGFEKVVSHNQKNKQTTETVFQQNWPYTGQKLTQTITMQVSGADNTLSASSWELGEKQSAQGGVFTYVKNKVSDQYDITHFGNNPLLSKTEIETLEIDAWGNTTHKQEKVTNADNDESFISVVMAEFEGDGGGARHGKISSQLTKKTRTIAGSTVTSNNEVTFDYFPSGNLETQTIEPNNSALKKVTDYQYDYVGNVKQEKTSAQSGDAGIVSRTVDYTFTDGGRYVETITNAKNQTISFNYNSGEPTGLIQEITQIDGNGIRTQQTFDQFGRIVTDTNGAEITQTYQRSFCQSNCSGITQAYSYELVSSPSSATQTVMYDKFSNQVGSVVQGMDGTDIISESKLDWRGLATQVSTPSKGSLNGAFYTVHQYDALKRLTQSTVQTKIGGPRIIKKQYEGYVTRYIESSGAIYSKFHNALGEPIATTDPQGLQTQFTYNAKGELILTQLNKNSATNVVFEYDDVGNKTLVSSPGKGAEIYHYNGFGELKESVSARMHVARHDYDLLGRKVSTQLINESGITEGINCWEYDNASTFGVGKLSAEYSSVGNACNATAKANATTLRTYSYNAKGQEANIAFTVQMIDASNKGITTAQHDEHYSIEKEYHPATGLLDKLTLPSTTLTDKTALELKYQYAYGYLTQVKNAQTSEVYQEITEMDARGNIIEQVLGNGVVQRINRREDTGEVDDIQVSSHFDTLFSGEYEYDSNSNLESRDLIYGQTDSAIRYQESFAYDLMKRLKGINSQVATSVSLQQYDYDVWGNISDVSALCKNDSGEDVICTDLPNIMVKPTEVCPDNSDRIGNVCYQTTSKPFVLSCEDGSAPVNGFCAGEHFITETVTNTCSEPPTGMLVEVIDNECQFFGRTIESFYTEEIIKECPSMFEYHRATDECRKSVDVFDVSPLKTCPKDYDEAQDGDVNAPCEFIEKLDLIVRCPSGYHPENEQCFPNEVSESSTSESVVFQDFSLKCDVGELENGKCKQATYADILYQCTSGVTPQGVMCSSPHEYLAEANCPAAGYDFVWDELDDDGMCVGVNAGNSGHTKYTFPPTYSCPEEGDELVGSVCVKTLWDIPATVTCDTNNGYSLVGGRCTKATSIDAITYCPTPYTENEDKSGCEYTPPVNESSNASSPYIIDTTLNHDASGNAQNYSGQTLTYTTFDKIKLISRGDNANEWTYYRYDSNNNASLKIEKRFAEGKVTQLTTQYINALYERVTREGGTGDLTEEKYYIGDIVITRRSNQTESTFYQVKDQQGSVLFITNEEADIVKQYYYAPFGDQQDITQSFITNNLRPSHYGYTGHEHIKDSDIINMKGRIYSSSKKRFLQADPLIGHPFYSQSYNPYQYVYGNPLVNVDPSGYVVVVAGTALYAVATIAIMHYNQQELSKNKRVDWNFPDFSIDPNDALKVGWAYALAKEISDTMGITNTATPVNAPEKPTSLINVQAEENSKLEGKSIAEVQPTQYINVPEIISQPLVMSEIWGNLENHDSVVSRDGSKFKGKSKLKPNVIYTYVVGPKGKIAKANYITNEKGEIFAQADFDSHGKDMLSGHGHWTDKPNDMSELHNNHISHEDMPSKAIELPVGIKPNTPVGEK